jgi:hypothetical protein
VIVLPPHEGVGGELRDDSLDMGKDMQRDMQRDSGLLAAGQASSMLFTTP